MKDLFGVEITEKEYLAGGKPRSLSVYQRRQLGMDYRKAKEGEEQCGECSQHIVMAGAYHKCKLIGVSRSEATDIRVRHTCDRWEEIL